MQKPGTVCEGVSTPLLINVYINILYILYVILSDKVIANIYKIQIYNHSFDFMGAGSLPLVKRDQ